MKPALSPYLSYLSQPKPAAAGVDALIGAEVDELGALEKRLLPFRADLARIEILRKAVRARLDESPDGIAFQLFGDKFFAAVGPRALERTIAYPKLIKAIGLKAFAGIATVTLKALDEYCACGIVAAVVSSANTGARSVKTFERMQ